MFRYASNALLGVRSRRDTVLAFSSQPGRYSASAAVVRHMQRFSAARRRTNSTARFRGSIRGLQWPTSGSSSTFIEAFSGGCRARTRAFHVASLRSGAAPEQLAFNLFNSTEFNIGGRFIAGIYVGTLHRTPEHSGWTLRRDAMIGNRVPSNIPRQRRAILCAAYSRYEFSP